MDKITVQKGQVLHRKGEPVQSLELLLAGAIQMEDGEDLDIRLSGGTILGASYAPGDTYAFDYTADSDSTLVVFDYASEDDIFEAVTNTPAIAPVIAAASMRNAAAMLDALSAASDAADALCKELAEQYREYAILCVKAKKAPASFPVVECLSAPEPSGLSSGWEASLCRAACDHQGELKKAFYALDLSFCFATVLRASHFEAKVRQELAAYTAFQEQTKTAVSPFVSAYYQAKARVEEQMRNGSGDVPVIAHALDMILAFSGVAPELADAFRKDIEAYTAAEDRFAKSDAMRLLRRRITDTFYAIYESAFWRSMDAETVPLEVRMFFLFGFVDETLAGRSNTDLLARIALDWEEDPEGRILSAYEWLARIYRGTAVPSKDEFDNDWESHLREEKRNKNISADEEKELQTDRRAMVQFEIQHMFKLVNRNTYGRLSSFVPVFHAQNVLRPLDKSLASPAKVRETFDRVLAIDYGCFYRQTRVALPQFKIPYFFYHTEVKPYILLMPNVGSRGVMWQEIEGARRTTPAHMMLSIFHSEDLYETVIKMCAIFRWELCRRIQGVRYADIQDPSLTAEYMNYLLFYRRDGYLSSEAKEHIKLSLQKARNDYKKVFMSDYLKYIQNESAGMPKLTKPAREILFRYCTFAKDLRTLRGSNPQYRQLMERWSVKQSGRIHNLDLVVRKIERSHPEALPPEVEEERRYLSL